MAHLGGTLRDARHTIEPDVVLQSKSVPVNTSAIVIGQVVVNGDTCLQSDLINGIVQGQRARLTEGITPIGLDQGSRICSYTESGSYKFSSLRICCSDLTIENCRIFPITVWVDQFIGNGKFVLQ